MNEKNFIQVGVTALRTPTGRHYPPVPLYIETDKLNASGLAPCEEKMLTNFASFLRKNTVKKFKRKRNNIDENIVSS